MSSTSSPSSLIMMSVAAVVLAILVRVYALDMVMSASGYVMKQALHRSLPTAVNPWEKPASTGHVDLSMIGLGFGNQATKTQKVLEKVGLGRAYHMYDVLTGGAAEHDKWYTISKTIDKTERQRLLREALRGRRSAMDFPASMYWKDLIEMFPNANVVMNTATNAASNIKDSAMGSAMGMKDAALGSAMGMKDSAMGAKDSAMGMKDTAANAASNSASNAKDSAMGMANSAESWAKSQLGGASNYLGAPYEYHSSQSWSDVVGRGPILGPGLWLFFKLNPLGMRMGQHFTTYRPLYHKDPQEFARVYNEWIDDVKKTVPADKLVQYNFNNGYEQLSKLFANLTKTTEVVQPQPTGVLTIDESEDTTWFSYVLATLGWLTISLPLLLLGLALPRFIGTGGRGEQVYTRYRARVVKVWKKSSDTGRDLWSQWRRRAQETAHNAQEKARETATKARETAEKLRERAQHTSTEQSSSTEASSKKNTTEGSSTKDTSSEQQHQQPSHETTAAPAPKLVTPESHTTRTTITAHTTPLSTTEPPSPSYASKGSSYASKAASGTGTLSDSSHTYAGKVVGATEASTATHGQPTITIKTVNPGLVSGQTHPYTTSSGTHY